MYLIGHTDPSLIMRIYQQVLDMGDAGVETLETVVGCTLTDAFRLLSGRGVCPPIVPRAKKMPPSPTRGASWKARKRLVSRTLLKAADGTRTHDLLHGKQTLIEPVGEPFTCESR
jgi:hypothetical protein